MNKLETLDEIRTEINTACIEVMTGDYSERLKRKVGEIANDLTVEFSNRLKTSMGYAYYRKNIIRLSTRLWSRATITERRDTIRHELAHIVSFKMFGYRGTGHGANWKYIARQLGCSAARCHNVDTSYRPVIKKNEIKLILSF